MDKLLSNASSLYEKGEFAQMLKVVEKLDKERIQELAKKISIKAATVNLFGQWTEELEVSVINMDEEVICPSATMSSDWKGCISQTYNTAEGLYKCAFLVLHESDFDLDSFSPISMELLNPYNPDLSGITADGKGDRFNNSFEEGFDESEYSSYEPVNSGYCSLTDAYLDAIGVELDLTDGRKLTINYSENGSYKIIWLLFASLILSSGIQYGPGKEPEFDDALMNFMAYKFDIKYDELLKLCP